MRFIVHETFCDIIVRAEGWGLHCFTEMSICGGVDAGIEKIKFPSTPASASDEIVLKLPHAAITPYGTCAFL